MSEIRPRHLRISEAVHYSKISRSRLYELAGEHAGLFVKAGRATLVNLAVLDRLLDSLGAADIKSGVVS